MLSHLYIISKKFLFLTCILIKTLRSTISMLIYKKALKISLSELSKDSQSAKFTSLITVDIELLEGMPNLSFLSVLPVFLLLSAILL